MVAVDRRSGTAEQTIRLHDATVTVRAVDALDAIGAFDRLGDRACTTATLAEVCGVDPEVLGLALDVAHLAGVIGRSDGHWTLDDRTPLRMMLTEDAVRTALLDGVRTFDVAVADQSGDAYAPTVGRIGTLVAPFQAPLIEALSRPGQHVLELAAGASPWGRALCDADATTTVTAVDLPAVLPATERAVVEAGHTDRYRFVAADVFAIDDLPPGDLVVIAGFCRLVSAARNHELLQRAARWCLPGGRVAIVDAVATPEARAAGLSRYELGLRTRTSEGRCWSLDHFARWLRTAGFVGVDIATTARPELSLVTARKEESP